MHATDFGLTLIIANPAAQSGAAHEVAERLQRFLDMTARASQFDLVLTERMGHAKELAAQAQGYRTVIALGGDGVIHEVVNGLMTQEEDTRPALAILPVGSGNDFAQTLGIDDFSGKDLARCSPASCSVRTSGAFARGALRAAAARLPLSTTTRRSRSASMPPSAWAPPSCAKRRASPALRSTPYRDLSSLACAIATTP